MGLAHTAVRRVRAAARELAGGSSSVPANSAAPGNFEYNRGLWDDYAQRWSDPAFRARQLKEERTHTTTDPASIRVLGEEWGRPEDVQRIFDDWIAPHLASSARVGEIGSGGGRIAGRVVDKVETLYCFDNSAAMLQKLVSALPNRPSLIPVLLTQSELPPDLSGTLDFVYAFDVFVHFDLHLLWKYLQEIHRVLVPGGSAFIHTSNITAPAGWQKFAAQDHFRVEGHYPLTPEVVRTLVHHSGLVVERESTIDASNFYLARDYLALLRRT